MKIFVIFHNNEDNLHLLSVSHMSIRRWVRGCCLPLQTPETNWEDAAMWLRPVLGRCVYPGGGIAIHVVEALGHWPGALARAVTVAEATDSQGPQKRGQQVRPL